MHSFLRCVRCWIYMSIYKSDWLTRLLQLALIASLKIKIRTTYLKPSWLYTVIWSVMQQVSLVYVSPILCFPSLCFILSINSINITLKLLSSLSFITCFTVKFRPQAHALIGGTRETHTRNRVLPYKHIEL